jgi:hypothetical protein
VRPAQHFGEFVRAGDHGRRVQRPGWRESRSIGPEIDTAAMTRPDGPRTGAETEATPGSRSPTLCAQPRRRTADSAWR